MNQKYIKWIGIVNGILAMISGGISIFKELKELIALTILLLLLSLICFFVLWYKERNLRKISEKKKNNKIKRLEKDLREKENENKALKKEMCQECKKIYAYSYPDDEWVSFDENPNKNERFSLIEEIDYDYKEMSVHHLNSQWIFISFWGEEEKDYLIDLIGTTIYLPISKWEESKRDDLTSYKILCSNRKIHLDFSQLL